MSASTQGIRPRSAPPVLRDAVELLSSMRFAISLLTLICIASVIGTVLKQQEPLGNYINQFGPFWAEVFTAVHLNTVYSAWWFLLILAFLVTSTSLCVIRNAPKILADLRNAKENIRAQSLQAFGHKAAAALPDAPEAAALRLGGLLAAAGWKVKLQQREGAGDAAGWMVAARAGAANKLGYIAAHSAIVLVCVGGLLDGDLMVRAQMLWGGKTAWNGGGMIADVKPEHRLSPGNPTFRANLLVAEGTQSSTAILNQPGGVLVQDLPFSIELKKFVVEHYSTGMPKLFASDIVIHDKETGQAIPARVEVNHPVNHRGVEIYQSSFDDGGSSVRLRAMPLVAGAQPFDVEGVIGGSSRLTRAEGADQLTLEYAALRVINVENMGAGATGSGSGADVRKVDLRQSLDARLGAANKTVTKKELRNVGPSITYRLRDAAGQAREFHNYMLPVDMGDGQSVYLLGSRDTPAEPFRYLRVPADDKGGLDGFVRLHTALADPAARDRAVKRYAAQAIDPGKPELRAQLEASAQRALGLFAGADAAAAAKGAAPGGLAAVSNFIETNVPEAERARASEVLIRILSGTLFELAQVSRMDARLPLLEPGDKVQAFMTQSVLALSDAFFYPAPMVFMLKDFSQVQASVFQVARAPGKTIVYLGCVLLIVGIFAMLYVRERRVWIWITAREAGSHAQMALSTNRKTMDGDREFENLRSRLLPDAP